MDQSPAGAVAGWLAAIGLSVLPGAAHTQMHVAAPINIASISVLRMYLIIPHIILGTIACLKGNC
jgi:hypothetical protein